MKFYLKIVCFFLLAIGSSEVIAQQFTISGAVMEKGQQIRIALADITNRNNGFSVGSNDMGLFSIKGKIGDTLMINKRGYNIAELVIKDQKSVLVQLIRDVTMLDAVTVYGQNKKTELQAIKKEFKNKGSFYGGKPPLLSFIFSPLTAFYELFGRTPKNARRFNNMYTTELQNSVVDQLFNKLTINQETGLTGKELESFLVNYRPDYEKAKNWNTYDATKWIKDSYKQYTDTLKR